GEFNDQGIPDAMMQCGSPRNYFVIHVDKKGFRFDFKGIGLDSNQQMQITRIADTLVANIFAGSAETTVEYSLNGVEWFGMEKVRMPAPAVLRLIELNSAKKLPALGKRITPLRKRDSPHIWQSKLPKLPKGVINLQIRARDSFGFHVNVRESFVNQ